MEQWDVLADPLPAVGIPVEPEYESLLLRLLMLNNPIFPSLPSGARA